MLETERLFLLPITLEIIDALLVSDDFFYSKYNYKNDGGEYLIPSPEYLHKIRKRLVDHPEEYPLAVDYLINRTTCKRWTLFKPLAMRVRL